MGARKVVGLILFAVFFGGIMLSMPFDLGYETGEIELDKELRVYAPELTLTDLVKLKEATIVDTNKTAFAIDWLSVEGTYAGKFVQANHTVVDLGATTSGYPECPTGLIVRVSNEGRVAVKYYMQGHLIEFYSRSVAEDCAAKAVAGIITLYKRQIQFKANEKPPSKSFVIEPSVDERVENIKSWKES